MSHVVIVTGATGGLGGAIATKFGARGDKVVVNYHKDQARAQALVGEISKGNGQALAIRADVISYQDVEAMVAEVISRWGRIDVLVNNAGGGYSSENNTTVRHAPLRPIVDTAEEAWDYTVAVNLKGAFNCIKAVGRQMMEQREGHVINIGSSAGLLGHKGTVAYSTAKAGLLGLSKVAARELGEYNVRVNTVCPGMVPHAGNIGQGYFTEETVRAFKETHAVLHRTATPEEFAEVVVMISELTNMSGQLINTDSRIF